MPEKRILRRMTEEQAEIMIEAYLNGMPSREAAALFGFTKRALTELLRRRGLPVRSQSNARKLFYENHPDLIFHRTYSVDDTFFDFIDTEEKAYWLGFFTADGNVNPENSAVRLTLQIADEGHILKFKQAVQSEHPLYYNERTQSVGIEIGSRRLMKGLIRLGVVANKTYSAHPCPEVPEDLLRHYWRGLVDGDGSVSLTGPHKQHLMVALSGTREIVEGFRQYVSQFVESRVNVWRGHGYENYQVSYAHKRARQICTLLYKDAIIYLDRKYETAQRACDW